jgi:hypothetical protein
MRCDKLVPFWEKLPTEFTIVDELQRKLDGTKSQPWREVHLRELLRLSVEFKAFPSVRTVIADYIAKIERTRSRHHPRGGLLVTRETHC